MTPGLSEYATEERNYILWLNFEFCEFGVCKTAYDGGLRSGGNLEVYVFLGGGRKACCAITKPCKTFI